MNYSLLTREISLGRFYRGLVKESLTVSPDSRNVAYGVSWVGKQFIVLNGHAMKEYDGVTARLVFSSDSKHLAYGAKRGGTWSVVRDDAEGKAYDGITGVVFSPNSERLAYCANERMVVLDDIEGRAYDGIGDLAFSPDGRHLAYAARRGDKWLVVVDGVEDSLYDSLGKGSLVFSRDSKRMTYGARRGQKWIVVANGVESREYDGLGAGMAFSPDSKKLAYAARRGEKWTMMVDGVGTTQYDGVLPHTLLFSPDSERLSFVAVRGEAQLAVVDGREGKQYVSVYDPLFSLDSCRVAYVAGRTDKWLAVIDGVEGPEYDGLVAGSLLFSPNSQHVAYGVHRGSKRVAVIDGVPERKEYDWLGELVFSPDSQCIAYAAQHRGEWVFVVDGAEGKEHEGIVEGSNVVFDKLREFHALVVKNKEFFRIEVEIVEDADGKGTGGRNNDQDDRLLALLNEYLHAKSPQEAQRLILERAELLGEAAHGLLSSIARLQPQEDTRRLIEKHRTLLQRCREVGVETAFVELSQAEVRQLFQPVRAIDTNQLIQLIQKFLLVNWDQRAILVAEHPELLSDVASGLMLKLAEAQPDEEKRRFVLQLRDSLHRLKREVGPSFGLI